MAQKSLAVGSFSASWIRDGSDRHFVLHVSANLAQGHVDRGYPWCACECARQSAGSDAKVNSRREAAEMSSGGDKWPTVSSATPRPVPLPAPVADNTVEHIEAERLEHVYIVKRALTGDLLQTPDRNLKLFQQSQRDSHGDCSYCYTMIGNGRADNIQHCMLSALKAGVQGDFLEAGVWRGGASIFAKTLLDLYARGEGRRTYACDSFEGLPKAYDPHDSNTWNKATWFVAGEDVVRQNFQRFHAYDDSVHFVKGYFNLSLPVLKQRLEREGRKIMVLRGDGDMYGSYKHILYNLYGLLSIGGYFICDDCPGIKPAWVAVNDFRQHHGNDEQFLRVNGSYIGMYWQKTREVKVDYKAYLDWRKSNF
eukprot:CAMPEP_0117461110 /NCGR_PEP_ID=MMETSP0784-20121206/2354_1 /TAXON_ID=39447 /ORGANISM="" /LENGTH=365 /DNA_ID=CAMNT_0005254803 /DNA_START=1 /DNA_END=1099 /DNA_ORIENTATION=+